MTTPRPFEGQMMLPVLHPDLLATLTRRVTPGWQAQAACVTIYPDLFFPEPDERGAQTEAAALDVCNGCRVRSSCRAAALINGEQGVWGGTTDDDRDRMRDALASGTSVDAVLLATLGDHKRDAA